MKNLSLIIVLFIFGCSSQQNIKVNENLIPSEINSKNYYDFAIKPTFESGMVQTDWIREDEIINLLSEEFDKKGYKLKENVLFKLNENEFIIVNGFCEKYKFGFIVESGHSVPINKTDRKLDKPFQYTLYHSGGRPKFVYTKAIPKNIFIFRENWYWFQECPSCEDRLIVDKEIAKNILLEDLRNYLNEFKE